MDACRVARRTMKLSKRVTMRRARDLGDDLSPTICFIAYPFQVAWWFISRHSRCLRAARSSTRSARVADGRA